MPNALSTVGMPNNNDFCILRECLRFPRIICLENMAQGRNSVECLLSTGPVPIEALQSVIRELQLERVRIGRTHEVLPGGIMIQLRSFLGIAFAQKLK